MTGYWNVIKSMKGLFVGGHLSATLVWSIFFLHYVTLISAEQFHLHRDPSIGTENILSVDKNKVTTYDQCKKYLCKYGYLKQVCECHIESMRDKRSLMDDLFPSEDLDSSPQADNPEPSAEPLTIADSVIKTKCTQDHFRKALETFQINYRLNITGVCDQRTTAQMSLRRCGQPDDVISKSTETKSDQQKNARKTRSLGEIISKNTELEKSIERRKRQLQDYIKEIQSEVATPGESQPDREKRSVITMETSDDYGELLSKTRVSWRLMSDHYSHIIDPQKQRAILKQAFRYWSEVAPLCFYEDNSTPNVDIEIGFLEGVHLSCYRQFDGYGGEIAHKFNRDVHFDNSEPYTTELTSQTAISLLLVAVHELGHVLGLNHSDAENSVMNAIYHQSIRGEFELSDNDRQEVKRAYGPCSGKFDTAFDYVRSRSVGDPSRIYNTYFFRQDHYWMYENNNKRARFGDPLLVTPEWPGLPNNVDAFLHYFEVRLTARGPEVHDEYFFFRGDTYYAYESIQDRVIDTGKISSKFKPNTATGVSIPNNLDSAFFDIRDKNIYFFKDDYVYIYNYKPDASHACCVTKEKIIDVFPPASQSDRTSPTGVSYNTKIDSVYFSYYHSSMYFIKGDDVWQNTVYRLTGAPRSNSMKYVGKWYDLWQFICDGECS